MMLQQTMMKQVLTSKAKQGTPDRIDRPLQISSNSLTATEGGRSVVKELYRRRSAERKNRSDKSLNPKSRLPSPSSRCESRRHSIEGQTPSPSSAIELGLKPRQLQSDLHIDQRELEERRAKIKRDQRRKGNASGSVETVAGASSSSSEFSSGPYLLLWTRVGLGLAICKRRNCPLRAYLMDYV
ncbi:hypothetical protein YC2023_047203 [Brassica napus]